MMKGILDSVSRVGPGYYLKQIVKIQNFFRHWRTEVGIKEQSVARTRLKFSFANIAIAAAKQRADQNSKFSRALPGRLSRLHEI
jgi:hypothetical protein